MFLVWFKFLFCALIVVVSGTKLTRYGDAIAEKTGLTRAWVGLLLLATITSMPELISGISAAAIAEAPDLSLGIVLGSNLFNLLIIAILDILYRPEPLLSKVSKRQILPAGLSIIIIALAGLGIFLSIKVNKLGIGWISGFSLLLLLFYLFSLRIIFRSEQRHQVAVSAAEPQSLRYKSMSSKRTYLNFALAAIVIIGSAIWLANIGDEIARVTGWGESFVGSLFLAIVTSMPEMVVCTAALRLGAIDMAVADLIGSNLFNTGIIIIASDIFYWPGPLPSLVSINQVFTALIAILMTLILLIGILLRSRRKALFLLSWESLVLIVLYFIGAYILFITGVSA